MKAFPGLASTVGKLTPCGFHDLRHSTGFQDLITGDKLPEAALLHVWAAEPPALGKVQAALANLPPPIVLSCDLGHLHLFTDGSGILPTAKGLTLASWAVQAADCQGHCWCLAAGPLPGLVQSVFRAELFAVVVLLRCGRGSSAPFRIWSDCLAVVNRVRHLQQASQPPRAMAANGDLWMEIWEIINDLGTSFLINHIPAHEDIDSHADLAHSWLLEQNASVDAMAGAANFARTDTFWESWHALKEQMRQLRTDFETVVAFHTQVAARSIKVDVPALPSTPFAIRGNQPLRWPATASPKTRAAQMFGAVFTNMLSRWMQVFSAGSATEARWVSWVLYDDHWHQTTNLLAESVEGSHADEVLTCSNGPCSRPGGSPSKSASCFETLSFLFRLLRRGRTPLSCWLGLPVFGSATLSSALYFVIIGLGKTFQVELAVGTPEPGTVCQLRLCARSWPSRWHESFLQAAFPLRP